MQNYNSLSLTLALRIVEVVSFLVCLRITVYALTCSPNSFRRLYCPIEEPAVVKDRHPTTFIGVSEVVLRV